MPFVLLSITIIGIALGYTAKFIRARIKLASSQKKAVAKLKQIRQSVEEDSGRMLVAERQELRNEKGLLDEELRESAEGLKKFEKELNQTAQTAAEKRRSLDRHKESVAGLENRIKEKEKTAAELRESYLTKLEEIAGTSRDEIKQQIIQSLLNEERRDAQYVIRRLEEESQRNSETRAGEIVVSAIQRLPLAQPTGLNPTVLDNPSQDMLMRLIGREGRFIRTLETVLDVGILMNEKPEDFSLNSPDPIKREIAKATLDQIFRENRLNPEHVEQKKNAVTKEVTRRMRQEAEGVLKELKITSFPKEATNALGRLLYRYSYGQNNLYHSKEVALLAGMMARELGADPQIAMRGGLLHDIGKGFALDAKAHVEMGVDLAREWGEDPRVINAIAAHHNDFDYECVEAVIVQIADAISGSRPGARRETIASYLKRVENLERIAEDFEGVDKAFAIYAGRELRILANTDKIDDAKARTLASQIAGKIEETMSYPGRIKVTVIREMKISSYTR
jgi:ribonuclease Y